MARNQKTLFTIGAALDGSFKQVIGGARSQFNTLGATIKEFSGRQDLITRFQRDQSAVEQARGRLAAVNQTVQRLKLALRQDPADAGVAKALAKAQAEAVKLSTGLERARGRLRESQAAMDRSGISARDASREYVRLGEATEQLRRRQEALGSALARRDNNLQKRGALRGQMLDAVALGAALRAPIIAARDLESAEVRLSTVLNTSDLERDLAESRRHALRFSRDNITTAVETLDIQYALNSAGLAAEASRAGSEIVAKVATVTGGAAESVGEVVATVFNNLGGSLEGEAEERLAKIGDMLTKTQMKYQIRDFGQLGESMKYASPALSRFNVGLDQGLALIGQLNTAGLQGSQAGTAMAAMFSRLSKAGEEFGFDLVRDDAGQLDAISTLEEMRHALGGFDDLDQGTIDQIGKVFGEQGVRAFDALARNLDNLRDAQHEVGESTGVVDESYQRFLSSAEGQMKIFRNRTREVGVVVGSILLPPLNTALGLFGRVAVTVGGLAERFPRLAQGVILLTGTLIAGKVAAIGIAYAWTFVKGAWLSAVVMGRTVQATVALLNVQAATLGTTSLLTAGRIWVLTAAQKAWAVGSTLVTGATAAVTTGFRVMGAAVLANPLGLAIAAIAVGAYLVIRHWSSLTEFFGGLWESIKGLFGAGVEWLSAIWENSPVGLMLKAGGKLAGMVGKVFGGGDKEAAEPAGPDAAPGQAMNWGRAAGTAALGAALTVSPAGAGAMADIPELLNPATAISTNNNQHYEIVINATPGMDAKEIAAEVDRQLKERERQQAARRRGALYD